MDILNGIKKRWESVEQSGLPASAFEGDKLSFWRERILFIILILTIVFGFIRLIPIIILCNLNGQWLMTGMAILAWVAACFILYERDWHIVYRTWILFLIFYMFGISFLYFFGVESAGHDWFFRATVIVGIMLGMKAAIIGVSFNFLLLGGIVFLVYTGCLPLGSYDPEALKLWLIVMANSMVSNTIITFVIVLLFDGIDSLLFESENAVNVLRESEEKLKGAFEANPDPMVVYDADGYTQYLNSAFIVTFGWTMQELEGKKIPFVPEDQKQKCQQHIDQLFRTGNPVEAETRRITKNGKIIEVLLKAALIRNPEGKPMGTIVNLADITGSKKLEKQLRQARKMEAVGTLAGGIAHDFNNILQIINGYADIIIMDKDKKSSDYANLQTILDASQRAAKLIRQLLLFSRKVETETKILNPNHEIKQVANILSRTIPKMVKIHTHLSEQLWNIKADPVQIEQVLLNLGTNAADAMPAGGKLVIKTANVRITHDTIHDIVGIHAGDYVLLIVTDNGHGMKEEIIEHIFEPFFTTKDVGKGTGLGLASAYGIIKKHNGHISCKSLPGKGTTFRIYLPAYKEKEWVAEEIDDTTTLVGGAETILIVDDETTIRNFSSKALRHFGYSVIECSSGEDAVGLYIDQYIGIDLILLDIGMPGMGGYKCFEELLTINPDAKIMITTGYSKDEKVKKALDAGAVRYLGKPYKLSFLLKSVRETLDSKMYLADMKK